MKVDVEGAILEFPDDTPMDVIQKTIRTHFASSSAPSTPPEAITASSPTPEAPKPSLISMLFNAGQTVQDAPGRVADVVGLSAPSPGEEKSPGGFLKNVGRSGIETVLGSLFPIQAAGALKAPQEILERQEKPVMEQVKEIAQPIAGQYYPSTYSPENLYSNPVGSAFNAAMAVAPLAGLFKGRGAAKAAAAPDTIPEALPEPGLAEIAAENARMTPEQIVQKQILEQPKDAVVGALDRELASQEQIAKQVTPETPLSEIMPEPTDPVAIFTKALKEAVPIREKQEALYSKARSKRAGAIAGIGESVPGEQGYFAQLGALKGELPKVQFESLRSKLSQPIIDQLFNKVEQQSSLSIFEKVTAKHGLAKMMGAEGGSVPTRGELALLQEVFPAEMLKEVMAKRPVMEKLWTGTQSTLNLPRSMMSGYDMSWPFRQGLFLIGEPKQWGPAFGNMFKYAFDEKAYQNLKQDIQSRPTYQLMKESDLALTDIDALDLAAREENFISKLPEKIPVFGRMHRGSSRAFAGMANRLRADVFDSMIKDAEKAGLLEENPGLPKQIASFINTFSGRGDLGPLNRAAPILNAAFFSPRLIASRLQILNPINYAKMDPFVRKHAVKNLLAVGSLGVTALTLATLAGADVETDPTSSDFAKIKVGDTRYDLWGGAQQYVVLASRLALNQTKSSTSGQVSKLGEGYKPDTRLDTIFRFIRNKEAPVVSYIDKFLDQTDKGYKQFDAVSEAGKLFTPMFLRDLEEVYSEEGLAATPKILPGVFGVGVQTYDKGSSGLKKPIRSLRSK